MMKTNKFSLKKEMFLISLILLAPEIQAESAKVLFNYTTSSDLFAQEPRLGRLTNVCHTLADPIVVGVGFQKNMNTQNLSVMMTVNGKPVHKGYAPLSSLSSNKAEASTDTDLLIPWKVSVNGTAKGGGSGTSTVPEKYSNPFCFADGYSANAGPTNYYSPSTHGYFALFENFPESKKNEYAAEFIEHNRKEFYRLCGGRDKTKDAQHVWKSTYSIPLDNPLIPYNMIDLVKGGEGVKFLTSGIFYMDYDPPKTEKAKVPYDFSETTEDIKKEVDGSVSYEFPLKPDNSQSLENFWLDGGGSFVFGISNRNITSLKLDIKHELPGYSPQHIIFEWERASSYLNNVLAFKGITRQIGLMSAGELEVDTYNDASFYDKSVAQGYFRGTLVSEGALLKSYTDYIKDIMPLSLPAANPGDINLVNTERLVFRIGQSMDYGGDPTVTVYGQPLKFGPLYTGNKEAASAMQVRNACY